MALRQVGAVSEEKPKFAELNNLVSEKLGGKVLFATDDWFAVAENLLKDSDPEWREGVFTDCGKWMDGWETRRKRIPGYDWCIIKLGVPGVIEGIDVDTSFFTGNYVPRISLQAVVLTEEEESQIPSRKAEMGGAACAGIMKKVAILNSEEWEVIIPMTEARPGYQDTCHTYIPTEVKKRWTHIRLNIYPDGGIARLRVFGCATPDWDQIRPSEMIDLASVINGAVCLEYSDAHYGHPRNLITPGRGVSMADGWETARRLDRPPILEADANGVLQFTGYEWTVLRLGHPGRIRKIEIDTHHFKGNFPDSCRIEGCLLGAVDDENVSLGTDNCIWKPILRAQKLSAHARHFFDNEIDYLEPVSHVRIVIAPDGGISRVRLYGYIMKMSSRL